MKLSILIITLSISLFSGMLIAGDEVVSASALARLAAQLEAKHGALDLALDEGADTALFGSIDALEYDLGRWISDEQKEMVRNIYRDALSTILTPDVWIDASAEVYSRHLSAIELKDLTDFYQTESGASILAAQGSVAADLGSTAEALLDKNQQAFADQVDTALSQLFPDYVNAEAEK